tara:strand:- start:3033 stop:3509 length:477 start_codon:yes stop_codon:yes gene_type:complete
MNCSVLCIIGLVFLIANIYLSIRVDKSRDKKAFYDTLTPTLKEKYEAIIIERRNIYLTGYAYGLLLALILLFSNKYFSKKQKISRTPSIGIMVGVTLLTNYFYYILTPKSDLIVTKLDKEEQRLAWQKIYKTMQFNYHIGLVLGIIASGFFGASVCAI